MILSFQIGSFLIGFCHTDRFYGNSEKPWFFVFEKLSNKKKKNMARVPDNKLHSSLACSNSPGKDWR